MLDYKNSGLTSDHIWKVLESQDYDNVIDHFVVNHLIKLAETKPGCGLNGNIKMQQAAYFWKSKGYLSAVDIMKELAQKQEKIANSEQVKKELFGKIFGEEGKKMDKNIVE